MKLQEIIRNNYKFAGIAAASFLIDEGMKNYVEEYDVLDTPKEILDGKAVLRRYHNKGAFLNFGEQKRKLVTLLSVLLTVAVLVVFVLTLGMRGKKLLKAGLSLLLGGAFSNTYDRVMREYVCGLCQPENRNRSDRSRGIQSGGSLHPDRYDGGGAGYVRKLKNCYCSHAPFAKAHLRCFPLLSQLFLLIEWRSLRTLLRSDFRASTESERRGVRVNCNKNRNL